MRAAVLGATGFVGSALVPALAEHADVVAVSRRGDARASGGVEAVAADVADAASVRARARRRRRRLLPRPLARLARLRLSRPPRGGERRRARRSERASSRSSTSAAWATTARPVGAPAQPERDGRRARRRERAGDDVARGRHRRPRQRRLRDDRRARRPAAGDGRAEVDLVADAADRARRHRRATSPASRAAPEAIGESFDVGGPEVLTYKQMIERIARLRGRRPLIVEVPILSPRLSSYWLHLVTPVRAGVARPLVEGLRNSTIAPRGPHPRAVPFPLTPFDEAAREALAAGC